VNVKALDNLLRPDQVSTSPSERALHARGESYDEGVLPEVVVFPESTEDVVRVMRYAHQHGVPVTPVAVNSSLEGHTVPLQGGLSLDLTRMNRVLEYHPQDLLAVVQPGVTYPQLNERARRDGLFFPVDPGAHASLGGMISTNASGTAAVRYGVTADLVLALEVVLPTGDVIRTGSRARKSASGYNLTKLFCGAEGTLGVITEATVRLVGLPEAAAAARVPFVDVEGAMLFVTSLIQAGVPVARCELVDPLSIAAVNAHSGTRYPEEMTVFLEFHGNPAGIAAEVALARELAEHHGAAAFEASHDAAARAELWHARHNAFYAIVAQNPGKRSLITDLAVPISALPEAVTRSLAACREAGFSAYLIGHVGDGNFHLTIFYDEQQAPRVAALGHELVELALSLGGTSTGEHGVGLRKLRYMAREHGAALEVMRTLKRALDPHNIMNPGKKVPLEEVQG
jgi:D-lactate dehydrogenase (cytochrome)